MLPDTIPQPTNPFQGTDVRFKIVSPNAQAIKCPPNTLTSDYFKTHPNKILCLTKTKLTTFNTALTANAERTIFDTSIATNKLPNTAFPTIIVNPNAPTNYPDPELTTAINYDNSDFIIVGTTRFQVIVFDITKTNEPTSDPVKNIPKTEKGKNKVPMLKNMLKFITHRNEHAQQNFNRVEFLEPRRNTNQFFTCDVGPSISSVYRYKLDQGEDEAQNSVLLQGIQVKCMKHIEILDWIALGLDNGKLELYDYRIQQMRHATIEMLPTPGWVTAVEPIEEKNLLIVADSQGHLVAWTLDGIAGNTWNLGTADAAKVTKFKYFEDPTQPNIPPAATTAQKMTLWKDHLIGAGRLITGITFFEKSDNFVVGTNGGRFSVYRLGEAYKELYKPLFTSLNFEYLKPWDAQTVVGIGTNVIDIKALPYTNKFMVVTKSTDQFFVSSGSLNCFSACRSCSANTEFSCQSCYEGFCLGGETEAPFCKRICTKFQWYKGQDNSCQECHSSCTTCNGPDIKDCIICKPNFYKHPDESCHPSCQEGTWQDKSDPSKLICKLCHPECATCSGPRSDQCITCHHLRGFKLQVDKTCRRGCLPQTFAVDEKTCADCHPECKECDGYTHTSCTECFNPNIMRLNKNQLCRNCLDDYAKDEEVCNHTIAFQIVRNPFESVNFGASLSVKMMIPNFDYFEKSIKEVDWNDNVFRVSFGDLEQGKDYNYTFRVRKKSMILDIQLMKEIGFEGQLLNIQTVDNNRLLHIDKSTKEGLLLLKKFESGAMVSLIQPVEPSDLVNKIQEVTEWINWSSISVFIIILFTVMIFLINGVDFSSIAIDYIRVAKIVHRTSFINIDYPILMNTFFRDYKNLLQLGSDRRRDEVDIHEKVFRGKFSLFGVPVFPLINFGDKYLVYLITLISYFSYSQIAKYLIQDKDWKSIYERRTFKMIVRVKNLILFILLDDLIYSSMRNILHVNLVGVTKTNQGVQSFIISSIMFIALTVDISNLIVGVGWNSELDRIQRNNTPENVRLYERQNRKHPNLQTDLNLLRGLDDTVDMSLVDRSDKKFKGLVVLPSQAPDDDDGDEINFDNKYLHSAGIDFCMRGIRVRRLSSVFGRYYNTVIMIKFLLLQIVIVTTQTTPLMQTTMLMGLQFFSILFTLIAVFKGVFVHLYLSLKNILIDLGLFVFLLYCLFTEICRNGGTSFCYESVTRLRVMGVTVGMILGTIALSLPYLVWNVVRGIRILRMRARKDEEMRERMGKIEPIRNFSNFAIFLFFEFLTFFRKKKKGVTEKREKKEKPG